MPIHDIWPPSFKLSIIIIIIIIIIVVIIIIIIIIITRSNQRLISAFEVQWI